MKLKTKISKILKENTGMHMLDSGGSDGRRWQRNQSINFDKEPSAKLDFHVYKDGSLEIIPSINVYHFLCNVLEINETSKKLEKDFYKFAKKNDDYYLDNMEEFCKILGVEDHEVINTYNFDNNLDTVLQYATINMDHGDALYSDHIYILLQVHLGADVRGGYTKPYCFHVPSLEKFILGIDDLYTNAGIDFHGTDIIDSETGRSAKNLKEYFEVKEGKLFVKGTNEPASAYTVY